MKLADLKNLANRLNLDASNIKNVYDNLTIDEYEECTGSYCSIEDSYLIVLPVIKGIDYNAPDLIKRGSRWFVVVCNSCNNLDNKSKAVNAYIKMIEAILGKEFFVDDDIEASIFDI